MRSFKLEISSDLSTSVIQVWQRVSTLEGVNDELAPLLRMTAPRDKYHLPFTQAPLGQTIFASWLLLFGVVPFDRHWLRLEEVWEGGFREKSYSLMHCSWHHQRILVPHNGGCTLTDTVEFEPRIPLMGYFLLPMIRIVFQNRHSRLQHRF